MSEDNTENFSCTGADVMCSDQERVGVKRMPRDVLKEETSSMGDPAKDKEGELGRREGL